VGRAPSDLAGGSTRPSVITASARKLEGIDNSMKHETPFRLPLSPAQVQLVASASTGSNGLLPTLLALAGDETVRLNDFAKGGHDTKTLSISLVSGLLVLATVSRHEGIGVTQVAHELGLSSATAWRYLKTWVALGVFEQDPRSHRYRLADCWR
jgi:hypothetical protein